MFHPAGVFRRTLSDKVMARKIFGRILFVLYIGAIAYLCFSRLDSQILSKVWFGITADKYAHCLMFIPFPFLMYLAFHRSTGRPWTLVGFLILVIVLGMAVGAGIEWVQSHLDYRSADVSDFRADNIGTAIGVVITFLIGAVTRKW